MDLTAPWSLFGPTYCSDLLESQTQEAQVPILSNQPETILQFFFTSLLRKYKCIVLHKIYKLPSTQTKRTLCLLTC